MDKSSQPSSAIGESVRSASPYSTSRMKLNIGGTLFETTMTTVGSAGPDSLFSTLTSSPDLDFFIDRDPSLFSPILSLLRTRRLPSSSLKHFSSHQLLQETHFYGLNHSLLSSTAIPPPLSPFDASLSYSLAPPSDPFVSALSYSDSYSTLLLAHQGVVSTYLSSPSSVLSLSSSTRTHLDHISSVLTVSDAVIAAASDSSPGLHFYSTASRNHAGSTLWVDPADPRTNKARVTAIANGSDSSIFAAFECRHGENAVLVVDKDTVKVVSEIGRQSGTAAKSAAMRKLTWVPAVGLLIGSSVRSGTLGYSGYIRAWDPRVGGEEVWETSEPGGTGRPSRIGDTMADVDVDPEGMFIAKVGCQSGDLGVADLRSLGPDPWVYLEDPSPRLGGAGLSGKSVVVRCYRKHVVVAKGGALEAWSRLKMERQGDETDWGLYRKNYVDKEEDEQRGFITMIECGGNRMFVCRENVEGVEVWETSSSSGVEIIQ